ncbi:MAG TPA: hypothetical protein VFJ06_06040 [Halococcus sp.]|nr:hypothetical protein [Halococcus sp.]
MATETVDERASHRRSLTVTPLAALAGIVAGLVSSVLTGGVATDPVGLYPLAAAIFLQLPALRLLGIDVEDFSAKDNLYVAFMAFCFWFVTWTVLLTAHTTL